MRATAEPGILMAVTTRADSTRDLHHEEHGDGPPILCVHGTGTYRKLWWPSMDPIAATHRVIVYDRRGFGASADAALASSLADHVSDAAALLRTLDAGPTTVVAMSGGGVIALALAIAHPKLVSGLILAEPAYQMAFTPSLAANRALAATAYRRLRGDPEAAALGFYRWASARMSGGNGFDPMPEEWKRTGLGHARAVFHELPQLIRPYPRAREVAALSCPVTLVIADDGQPVFRRTTERVRRLLPDATTTRIEGAGHLIPTDQPAGFAAAVTEALA